MRRGKLSRAVVYRIEDSRAPGEKYVIIVEATLPVACTCTNARKCDHMKYVGRLEEARITVVESTMTPIHDPQP